MSMNHNPTRNQLRWFGLGLAFFFTILGVMISRHSDFVLLPKILWTFGGFLVATYYLAPKTRRPIFDTWTTLTFPIGWLLTHLVLALIFYGLFTPLGLVMRLFGRDTMGRKPTPETTTFWLRRENPAEASRYFRQF